MDASEYRSLAKERLMCIGAHRERSGHEVIRVAAIKRARVALRRERKKLASGALGVSTSWLVVFVFAVLDGTIAE